jgi:hypothetical protein
MLSRGAGVTIDSRVFFDGAFARGINPVKDMRERYNWMIFSSPFLILAL